jgi:hypothetical protein
MGFYSGGIVPSAGAELQLSSHAPPPSEGARRATAMKLTSPFSGFNGHAARLTLSRASATSRPPLPAKCHGVLLAKLVLEPCLGRRAACAANDRAIAGENGPYHGESATEYNPRQLANPVLRQRVTYGRLCLPMHVLNSTTYVPSSFGRRS